MVEVRRLGLGEVVELTSPRFGDARGFFQESWSRRAFAEAGYDLDFVQDNHSYSASRAVLRGLHYQTPPFAQDKLLRVTRGSVFDVAVDIRRGSKDFGRWVGVVLSAEAGNQVLVPRGYAHGFLTLEEHTEVQYKVTAPYDPRHDRAIRYDDPAIGVAWPLTGDALILSDKDRRAPSLADADLEHDWS
ncbi:MAG TPA: dTDP-4-dehydrorhamnose 3,5-epimerase [Sphingomonadaceae bacterium]|nr:dTDP-4-dehydrorhamnose 3,5-epimerase [Sphingomonadaceae bacterium]